MRWLVPTHDVHVQITKPAARAVRQHKLLTGAFEASSSQYWLSQGCLLIIFINTKRTYETNAASQHEEPVEVPHPDDVLNLFLHMQK